MLQGAPADDAIVAARWAEALRFLEGAAEQGIMFAQTMCGEIYATGDRGVPQNWTTAAKWWRKAAEAGDEVAQWHMGLCYYYGRGVDRDVARAMLWFRKAASQGIPYAAQAVQTGIPGEAVQGGIARFTNAGAAAPRYEVARQFARLMVDGPFLGPQLQARNQMLQEDDSVAPHQSLRDSMWVDYMMSSGLSDEELELAKHIYAYAKRTCAFCGSNAAPLRKCSLCMDLRYCTGTDCQHAHWNKAPAAESHKVLCPRIFVRGSKGRTRRA
jgi:TPR repeat protein